jgi:CpeT protein
MTVSAIRDWSSARVPRPMSSRANRRMLAGRRTAAIVWLTCLVGCQAPPPAPDVEAPHRLPHLTSCMTGTFSSSAQADSDPDYHDIRLVMVRIWPDRADGSWLYVEQASADSLDRPYRQRVYRLVALDDGTFRSDIYTLPADPSRFAGCWRDATPLARLTPNDLELREGCSIVLSPADSEMYLGSTIGDDCASSIAGASYATSEVRITPTVMESWDRGFNAEGEQVWGATKGPYRFDKIADGPPQ